MGHILLDVLAVILMFLGLISTILPIIPGLPIMVFIYFGYGILDHWQSFSLQSAIYFLILTVLAHIFDYVATVMGAKKFGASREGIIGSIVGMIIGVIFFNIIGLIIGPFIGAAVGELFIGRSSQEALRSGWGTFVGLLASTIVKFTVGIIYFIYFVWQIL
jgi:hypothetical protein